MLLSGVEERRRAITLCLGVAGPVEEMSEAVVAMFRRFAEVLEVESGFAEAGPALLRPVA
jgi:hypothetical protein